MCRRLRMRSGKGSGLTLDDYSLLATGLQAPVYWGLMLAHPAAQLEV